MITQKLLRNTLWALCFGGLIAFHNGAYAGKICDPEVSKPCGATCIAKDLNCHKSWTTAKMGAPGRSTKKTYATPAFVETRPNEDKK